VGSKPHVLPPVLSPPMRPFSRTHRPREVQKDYTVYRDCLRWEFGFLCGVCLLHERDWAWYGTQDSALMHIEHVAPRSSAPLLVAKYDNLVYVCGRCNGARSDKPVLDGGGRRLLDPTVDAWGAHFHMHGGELRPNPGDADAAYTEEAYDINGRRKVELRLRRQRTLEVLLQLPEIATANSVAPAFLKLCAPEWEANLRAYGFMPDDVPKTCRCADARFLVTPPEIDRQLVDVARILAWLSSL
jgi:5-methylcytosine-specific restriction endonuclease McrA